MNRQELDTVEKLSGYTLSTVPYVDVGLMGEIPRIRNILLGTYLRDYQELCECTGKVRNHYFAVCKTTEEFRRLVGKTNAQESRTKL